MFITEPKKTTGSKPADELDSDMSFSFRGETPRSKRGENVIIFKSVSPGRRLARFISRKSRRRKFDLFMNELHPDKNTEIIDVGVANSGLEYNGRFNNFFEALYPWPEHITAVSNKKSPRFKKAFPKVSFLVADGCSLPFKDQKFDIAFSNAVVEHVGEIDVQRAFVQELCRVAKRVFVTTPNFWFPVETHTLLPLIHWLPSRVSNKTLRNLNLLSPKKFRSLFPYPVKLVNTGITLIAIGPQIHN